MFSRPGSLRAMNVSRASPSSRPVRLMSASALPSYIATPDILQRNLDSCILFRLRGAASQRFLGPSKDGWPPVFAAEAVKTGGQFSPSDLRQYSGIQIPKNQKPHPPNTGLNTGMAS